MNIFLEIIALVLMNNFFLNLNNFLQNNKKLTQELSRILNECLII
jgi:hypothetical protein